MRTCPSVLKRISSSDVPSNVYKQQIVKSNCLPEHQPVLKPRNVKHISNAQSSSQQRYQLTHDGLYNVHELAYDLDELINNYIS